MHAVLLLPLGACAPSVPASGCVVDGGVACAHHTAVLSDGMVDREVHWQAPEGDGPFPVAIGFQGSFSPAEAAWQAAEGAPFGGEHQARLTMLLLAAGFIVVTPEAFGDGLTFWNTNVPPWAGDWTGAPDDVLTRAVLAGVDAGDFGPADPDRIYAYGISSGGYMTSRMTDYPGRFAALAIVAGSWKTCAGFFCVLPDTLPADHPRTLFLHGEVDETVPLPTMQAYRDALADQGTDVRSVVHPGVGHQWSEGDPDEVVAWFTRD